MGIIFSRFRKKKSTLEVLEGLEKEIRSIEEFHRSTEQQHRKVMGHLMLYAVGLYVLVAFFFYFFFFPATLHEQILYLLPLLIMPILFIFVRRVITWYFRRKLSRNEGKLKDMKEQKKQLLEEVMDKETYKVARQILEKFAPDQLRRGVGFSPVSPLLHPNTEKTLVLVGKPGLVPSVSPRGPIAGAELRRRQINPTGSPPGQPMRPVSSTNNRIPSVSPMMPLAARESQVDPLVVPASVVTSVPASAKPALSVSASAAAASPSSGSGTGASQAVLEAAADEGEDEDMDEDVDGESPVAPMPLPLPRPILPHDRTVMDRLVEYLVGDGPSNRYALICQKCASHNGMALKEEFEYFAFRCCYCHHYNPARKQRPLAPRLESPSPHSTSTSEAESPPTSSEEEESATRPQVADPASTSAAESQPTAQKRASVDSGSAGEEKQSSQTPAVADEAPLEDPPCPGNPFELSDEDGGAEKDGEGDSLTSLSDNLSSPPLITSPTGPPAATSTPTADSCT